MHWLFLSTALLAAGFMQGLTGFGFGLVTMSLLPLVIGIKQAAAVSTIFSLLATITTFLRHYREYNWRLGFRFLLCVSVGVPIGVFFLEKTSERILLKILGTTMLLFAAREFMSVEAPKALPRVFTAPLGLFSGALSGAFNLGGIPSAAYAYSNPWSRGQIMAFLQVMILLSCTLRIGFYGHFGYFQELSPFWIAAVIAPVYGSIWLGHIVLARVHPRTCAKASSPSSAWQESTTSSSIADEPNHDLRHSPNPRRDQTGLELAKLRVARRGHTGS